jgi:hypothetical protein
MDSVYLESKVHRLELKITELESKLHRTASDAYWELSKHRSNVWIGACGAFTVFFMTVSVLLVLILR